MSIDRRAQEQIVGSTVWLQVLGGIGRKAVIAKKWRAQAVHARVCQSSFALISPPAARDRGATADDFLNGFSLIK
jgi:hypothetical protein